MNSKKCCDNCKWYKWYYDLCTLFNCTVNPNTICSCYFDKNTKS